MNKSELIETVSEKTEVTKKVAEKVVNAVFESITESLAGGDRVQVIGFGTFEVRQRGAREGRNPATGEKIMIPALKVPAFKAGKNLKDSVR
ncbi:MAG TPA: HU family DNA-binding protein [Firmicutes bacterium]|nr:HU family DNA-binding protein [Bacillota bacterium]